MSSGRVQEITYGQFKALATSALEHSGEDAGKQAIAALDHQQFTVNVDIFDQSAFNETIYQLQQRIHIAVPTQRGGTSRSIDVRRITANVAEATAREDIVREEAPADVAALVSGIEARNVLVVPEAEWRDNAGVPVEDDGAQAAALRRLPDAQAAEAGSIRVCVQKHTEHYRMALRTGTVFGLPWIAHGIGWAIGWLVGGLAKGLVALGSKGGLNSKAAQAIDVGTWARKLGNAFNFGMAALTIVGIVPLLLDKVDGRNKAALLTGAATLGLSWVAHGIGYVVGAIVGIFATIGAAMSPVDKRLAAKHVKTVGEYASEGGYFANFITSFISPVAWLVLWKGRKHLWGRPAPIVADA